MTTSTAVLRAPRAKGRAIGVRLLLLGAGLVLVALLVRGAGAARVGVVLAACGPWIPLVVALEIAFVTTDLVAARALLGGLAARVGRPIWIRSAALAYAATTLLPAGRAAGEATRAATLAPAVGTAHAAAVCARLQVAVLAANAVFSLSLEGALRGASWLALALVANGVVCGVLASVLLAIVRSPAAASWLRRRFARLVDRYAVADEAPAPASALVRAIAACVVGRGIQAVQYGVVVVAVGGAASATNALTAQAIHLVGAAVGDAIPGQVGALEGAYRTFAAALGLAGDPARALSIALAVRVAQLLLAAACMVVSTFVARTGRVSAI